MLKLALRKLLKHKNVEKDYCTTADLKARLPRLSYIYVTLG